MNCFRHLTRHARAGFIIIGLPLAGLPGACSGGSPAQIENLGQPCRAKNILGGRVVTDRRTGRELLALTNSNETGGLELLLVDFEQNTGEVYRAPAGSGAWAILEVPGDRLVIGTHYDGKFLIFDLNRMEFTKVVDFPGESYIWQVVMGSDGRVYSGTYGGSKIGALDLDTYALEDLGAPVQPNMYSTAAVGPTGYVICHFNNDTPATRVYNIAQRRFEPVPDALKGFTGGVIWNGYFVAGNHVLNADTMEEVSPPPFPVPPAEKGGWYVDEYVTTTETLCIRQGNAIYSYRAGDEALTLIADLELRGGRVLAISKSGAALGIRGQDYFVIRPGDTEIHLTQIPVEASGRPTLFLKADEQGRLWGGPHFGQTLFWMDPATGQVVNTPTVCDGGGEVYDVTFRDGKVYTASYAGGDITEYDPTKPWDQWNRVNPRPLTPVGPAYIRPRGGIMFGPGGKLYSGWVARYGTYGGAVGITDPVSGATEVIENPLGEQAVIGLATDEHFVYVGTGLEANGLPSKPNDSPRFGMLDPATREVVFSHTFEGASGVSTLACDARTGRVALAVDGRLWVFDPAAREFVPELPADTPAVRCNGVVAPGDGRYYYGSGKALVALDLATLKAETVAELPAGVSNVTMAPDGTLYASCGADVYRVRQN